MPKPTEHLLAAADKGIIVHERDKDTAPRRKLIIVLTVACLCGLIYLFWTDYVSWSEDRELIKSLMIKAEESKQEMKSMAKNIHSLKKQLRKRGEEMIFMKEEIQYMKEIFRVTAREMTKFMHKALEEMDFEEDSTF